MSLFESRWFRIYLLVVVGAALLAIVITVAVVAGIRPAEAPQAPVISASDPLKLSDFLIEDPVVLDEPEWQLMRPPREKWEHEEVLEFWVDPVELGIEKLGEENDRMVTDFFETVP